MAMRVHCRNAAYPGDTSPYASRDREGIINVRRAPSGSSARRMHMTDLVLIPFPGLGTLAMTREQFDAALSAGSTLSPSAIDSQSSPSTEELVDASVLEARTGVPASWWMAQARCGRIPFRKIGRRVRFDAHEVLNSSAFLRRSEPDKHLGRIASGQGSRQDTHL